MTDAHIIAIGGLGILALMLLYAHALHAGLPETVMRHSTHSAAVLAYQAYLRDRVWPELTQRPSDIDLMRWADDGGPA